MSDDTDSKVVHLPTRSSDSGDMPDAPDGGDLFYSEPPDGGAGGAVPPESPAETTTELPSVRGPISPETALRESGMPSAPDSDDSDDEEYEEGEYAQPRSLADRLGDWLEYRLEVARDRHAGEASFREAEIARKTALLEARTAQETAMMEQNGKLHAAMMKAKADKAAARGKADADRSRSSSSGMGADKGRSKASGGGGGSSGGGRGSGTNGSGGGAGRGSGGGNSPKGAGKGSDRSAGGRGGGSKGNESSGGSKGRQNGSGGSGKSGAGGSKGDGGKAQNSSASSPAAERARGRQERAAARQAARQQRRSTNQAANLADRSKDRDQDRANRQAQREERRAAKAERKAARKAKREAAKAADGRTTLGAAVAEEAQRRWDKRRADAEAKDAKDAESKDAKDERAAERKAKRKAKREAAAAAAEGRTAFVDALVDEARRRWEERRAQAEKDREEKERAKKEEGPKDTDGTKDASGTDRSEDGPGKDKAEDKPDEDPEEERDDDDAMWERIREQVKARMRSFFNRRSRDAWGHWRRAKPKDEPDPPDGPARPEDAGFKVYSPGRYKPGDPLDGMEIAPGPKGLPPAPEPHTERPGTTRPTAQEDPVTSEVNKPASGQAGMAAKHRTDITFGEYLVQVVNIAVAAGLDKDRAQELAVALGKVADALRDMAADLVGDHNIASEVVDRVTDLADAAMRMKQLAERCATECEIASEAARLAAVAVGRTYGEDIQAMDDAGLAHASAAVHHD
ncbi:ATP/GTP-binding protein [Streptomyces violaceusniger]|uniref:ATP/GTP-binding protein n=1 Tax=Streptomyces violaceusniger TaxID=68280 RepID=UPI00342B3AD3